MASRCRGGFKTRPYVAHNRCNTINAPSSKFVALQKELESSSKSHFVILSEAKDLVFTYSYEILRSLRSLRMTKAGTFAEVSTWYYLLSPSLRVGAFRPAKNCEEAISP